MPKYLLLHLLIVLSSVGFADSNVKFGNPPNWVEGISQKLTQSKAIESSNGLYYLLVDVQYNIKQQSSYRHYSYKLLTSEGIDNGSEISVNFDPSYQKLYFHQLDLIRDGKRINKLDKKALKIIQRETSLERKIYDGSKDAIFILEDTRVGDIIEYKYSLEGENPVFKNKFSNESYFQFSTPISEFSIKYISPKNRPLYFKIIGDRQKLIEKIEDKNDFTIYSWESKDIEAAKFEKDTPSWYINYPYIDISEYNNWKDVHKLAYDVFQSVDAELDSEFKTKIDNWKKNGIQYAFDSILYFIKDDIRYLGFESGISSFKPSPCKLVYKRRFGDCKDKSLLLASALQYLGVQAFPALVNTYMLSLVKDEHPRPTAFNHCVVFAKFGNKSFWFDPTIALQRGGYKNMYFPNYKAALVLSPNFSAFANIHPENKSNVDIVEEFSSNSFDSAAHLEVMTIYEGVEADNIRQYLNSSTKEDIRKSYQDFYASKYPHIEMYKDIYYNDNGSENVLTVFESYSIKEFWKMDSVGKNTYTALLEPIFTTQKLRLNSYAQRLTPLKIEFPLLIKHKIIAKLPEVWALEPFDNKIFNSYFQSREIGTIQGNEIELLYEYETFSDHIKANDYKKIYADVDSYQNNIGLTLTRPINNSTETNLNPEINILMVIIAIMFAILSILLCMLLYKYNPITDYNIVYRQKLNGWIFILLLTLIASLVSIMKDMFFTQSTYFDATIWNNVTNINSTSYNPNLAVLIVFELFFNVFCVCYIVLLIVLFFQRRNSFPILLSTLIIGRLVFFVLDVVFAQYFSSTLTTFESWKPVLQTLLSAIIWVPILNISIKVKETFTESLKEKQ